MKKMCPHVTSRLVGIKDGQAVYKKVPHQLSGTSQVHCTQCNTTWCCLECAVNCDAVDHHYFDMIYDRDKNTPAPKVNIIICCKCSGNKPSWEDRNDS